MPKAKKSETDKPVKLKDLKSKVEKPEKAKKARKKDKHAAAPEPVVAVEKPAKVGRKPAAAKALVAKIAKVAKPKPVAPPEPEIVITNDDIALRAYFIAERRQAMGWPGDSSSDWIEAESQLRAEAKRKAKK